MTNLLPLIGYIANKEIARRSDPHDTSAPLSSLERIFLTRDSSRLLIEIAVLARVIDDQMKNLDENDPERIRYY